MEPALGSSQSPRMHAQFGVHCTTSGFVGQNAHDVNVCVVIHLSFKVCMLQPTSSLVLEVL